MYSTCFIGAQYMAAIISIVILLSLWAKALTSGGGTLVGTHADAPSAGFRGRASESLTSWT